MCTVTFIPKSTTGFILTSNRDEAPQRNTLVPQTYEEDGVQLVYPKDRLAGGTWIGTSTRSRLICLLNGGFEPHERAADYRMSRGVIVTSLLTSENAIAAIDAFDFAGIEPFTIILVEWQDEVRLHELVWDGSVAHFSEKPLAPHIWSSSLLYPSEVKRQRETWFSNFLVTHMRPEAGQLLDFHKTAGEGNPETNLIMDRGFVKTKSISQVKKNDDLAVFRYEDLQTEETTVLNF